MKSILNVTHNSTLVFVEDISIGILSKLSGVKVFNITNWYKPDGFEEGKCPDEVVTHRYSSSQLIKQFQICKKQRRHHNNTGWQE